MLVSKNTLSQLGRGCLLLLLVIFAIAVSLLGAFHYRYFTLRTKIDATEYLQLNPGSAFLDEYFFCDDQVEVDAAFQKCGLTMDPRFRAGDGKLLLLTPGAKVVKLAKIPGYLIPGLEPQKEPGFGIAILSGEVGIPIKYNYANSADGPLIDLHEARSEALRSTARVDEEVRAARP